jgi:predicted nuclease of restriction endonuclease-like (RecB) superfamily
MKSSENNILPGYVEWLHGLANRYKTSQIKAAIAVNSEMLKFYWSLGADIVRLEPDQTWGSKFMQRLSEDIRREIPDAGCFSRINLYYMRWFFELYCMRPIVPQAGEQLKVQLAPIVPQVGEQLPVEAYQRQFPNVTRMLLSVPWGHHKVIIDKFKGRQNDALFYVRKIVENGWSRSMLEHWIGTNLHLREGHAVTNFDTLVEIDGDTDLGNELLKDPYDFSFLTMTERYREQELKDALVANIEKYMLELGQGFCFKGREYPLNMGSEVRPPDMLFYNDDKRFYLVVEVKVTKFEPSHVGQTNAYVAAVNHQLRKPGDGPTIGLIICKEKDRVTAKYSLEGVSTPIGIADYALEKFLPADFTSDLPNIEAIESDQTRRLQLLLEKRGVIGMEDVP